MNIHSKDEFVYKVNILKRHFWRLEWNISNYSVGFLDSSVEYNGDIYKMKCYQIMYYIKKLDYDYYYDLKERYNDFDRKIDDFYFDFLDEVGDYLVSLCNKPVDQNLIYEISTKLKVKMRHGVYSALAYACELETVSKANEWHYSRNFANFWPYEQDAEGIRRRDLKIISSFI